MKKFDKAAFQTLGELNAEEAPPDEINTKPVRLKKWEPSLEPAQLKLYECPAKYILGWSEKGSGKTWSAINKLVKHCVKWGGALALIIVRVKAMGDKGGAWEELNTRILPEWGLKRGIKFSKPQQDTQKNEFVWVQSESGKASKIVFISAPHWKMIKERMPGISASFAFVDELTFTDSDEYFKAVAAQIGRRAGIPGNEQQYVSTCNPAGPSHWVYKKWFEEPYNEETGEWDDDFVNIYFPGEENEKNLPEGYFKSLRKIYRNDPVATARLVLGEWRESASGSSLFGDVFSDALHVRPLDADGKPHQTLRLRPSPRHPIVLGIDSGQSYHAFAFMQWLFVDGRMRWVVFDEIIIIKKKTSYPVLMPVVMRRLNFWLNICGKRDLGLIAISDDSAFNQFRAATGSFDYLDMEREWNGDPVKNIPARNVEMNLPALKIKPAPKFPDSVRARIRIMNNVLGDGTFYVSAPCSGTQSMLRLLESKKQDDRPGYFDDKIATTIERSDYLHIFDAVTYVLLTAEVTPWIVTVSRDSGQELIRASA